MTHPIHSDNVVRKRLSQNAGSPLVEVAGLTVKFRTDSGDAEVLRGVGLNILPARTHCIVGESGSGKSVLTRAILQLLGRNSTISGGTILYQPEGGLAHNLAGLDPYGAAMRSLRATQFGIVFQEPMSSLSPVHTIGSQIAESVRLANPCSKKEARLASIELLDKVGVADPRGRFDSYPFELSGGLRQRAMIAMAIAGEPRLLIADEPTTALDVTTQAAILNLLEVLREEYKMALLFITHDLGVVREIADDVTVLYAGRVVESGPKSALFNTPAHPYTRALLAAQPAFAEPRKRLAMIPGRVPAPSEIGPGCVFMPRCAFAVEGVCDAERLPERSPRPGHRVICSRFDSIARQEPAFQAVPRQSKVSIGDAILQAENLWKTFRARRKGGAAITALKDVSLEIRSGETLALVGESGSGKSTLGKVLLGIESLDAGRVNWHGERAKPDVTRILPQQMRDYRQQVRMIFQDPHSSLNPRHRVIDIVGEPLVLNRRLSSSEIRDQVAHLLESVGLTADHMGRYPHAFSGGERQRICIARALALDPSLVICDEAVSALDVSVRAQILNLLADLKQSRQLTYLFITHDLSVVRQIADRVAVMQEGDIVELADTEELFKDPQHDYTRLLLASIPGVP